MKLAEREPQTTAAPNGSFLILHPPFRARRYWSRHEAGPHHMGPICFADGCHFSEGYHRAEPVFAMRVDSNGDTSLLLRGGWLRLDNVMLQ